MTMPLLPLPLPAASPSAAKVPEGQPVVESAFLDLLETIAVTSGRSDVPDAPIPTCDAPPVTVPLPSSPTAVSYPVEADDRPSAGPIRDPQEREEEEAPWPGPAGTTVPLTIAPPSSFGIDVAGASAPTPPAALVAAGPVGAPAETSLPVAVAPPPLEGGDVPQVAPPTPQVQASLAESEALPVEASVVAESETQWEGEAPRDRTERDEIHSQERLAVERQSDSSPSKAWDGPWLTERSEGQAASTGRGQESLRRDAPVRVPLEDLPARLATHFQEAASEKGRTELRLRLDPPHLGEIDVVVEAGTKGVLVRLVTHRPETMWLLQSQCAPLELELIRHDIPLESFSASLAGDPHGRRSDGGPAPQRSESVSVAVRQPEIALRPLSPLPAAAGRLDMRV